MRILAFLLAASAACAAGGAAGKWSGVIIVEDPNGGGPIRTAVELELAERSGAVDGRIGRKGDRERVAIRNGSVRGATVTFEAS